MTHNREDIWWTATGIPIKLKDLEVSHLVNILNWILDNKSSYSLSDYVKVEAEATYRQTTLFAERMPYPQKIGKRWKVVDPITGEGTIVPPPPEYIEAVKENIGYQRMAARTQKKRKEQDFNGN